jgi:hypothetical protein
MLGCVYAGDIKINLIPYVKKIFSKCRTGQTSVPDPDPNFLGLQDLDPES